MDNQEKTDLFIQWAYLKSKKLNKKYENMSEAEWANSIPSDEETSSKLSEIAAEMTEEDFNSDIQSLKTTDTSGKLDNLKELQSFKKGGKIKKAKCACGCELVETKDKGGKISSKCSCGCKVNKKEIGGIIPQYENLPIKGAMKASHKIKKFKKD